MRPSSLLRMLLLCAPLGAALLPCAHAAEEERRYTGLALTYHFGGDAARAAPMDLSFGRLQTSIDPVQDTEASVLHLPLVQVPLLQSGPAALAPVRAVRAVVQMLRAAPAILVPRLPPEAACASVLCARPAVSLPDLAQP